MKQQISTFITGAAGITSVEVVSAIPPETITQIGQTLIQIAIGIVTLWKLIKKPKENK